MNYSTDYVQQLLRTYTFAALKAAVRRAFECAAPHPQMLDASDAADILADIGLLAAASDRPAAPHDGKDKST